MDNNLAQPQVPQQYFSNETTLKSENKFVAFLKKIWLGFLYYARQAWPTISRLINFIVYETLKVLRGIVKISLQQVGMFKE